MTWKISQWTVESMIHRGAERGRAGQNLVVICGVIFAGVLMNWVRPTASQLMCVGC